MQYILSGIAALIIAVGLFFSWDHMFPSPCSATSLNTHLSDFKEKGKDLPEKDREFILLLAEIDYREKNNCVVPDKLMERYFSLKN